MKSKRELILASSSPRRQKTLKENGFNFTVISPDVDEVSWESAKETVEENSKRKAEHVYKNNKESIVIAADTVVCLEDKVLGKPKDLNEAKEMLFNLSNQKHEVYTAVSVRSKDINTDFIDVSEVHFKAINENTINHYHLICNPLDKAGAYNIDEHGDLIIKKITGSYENIMGFPIEKFKKYIIFKI